MGDCRLKVRGPCTRRIEHLSSHLYKIAVKRVDVPCTHAFNADTDNLEDEQPALSLSYTRSNHDIQNIRYNKDGKTRPDTNNTRSRFSAGREIPLRRS